MKTFFLCFFLCAISVSSVQSQWRFLNKHDKFYGKYKQAVVFGKSDKSPYNKPSLNIIYVENQGSFNIYIGNMGYTGCLNKGIGYIFDNENVKYMKGDITTNNEENAIHLSQLDNILDFIEGLKSYNKLYINYFDDCNDGVRIEFPLAGSTKAISRCLEEFYSNNQPEKSNNLEEVVQTPSEDTITIQFFKSKYSDKSFPSLAPIGEIISRTVGSLTSYQIMVRDREDLKKVQQAGFTDAYIIE